MNKYQALHDFWCSFGLPAYDIYSVPVNAELPYLTYSVSIGAIDEPVFMSVSLWYRSDSWVEIDRKANEIEQKLGTGGQVLKLDNGRLFLFRGTPFARRLNDMNDTKIKQIFINIGAEFFTAY